MADPIVNSVSPSTFQAGTTGLQLTISGSNFDSNATASLTNGIIVVSTTVPSSTTIQATVNVPSTASGSGDVTVSNPAGGSGTKARAYTVSPVDPTP